MPTGNRENELKIGLIRSVLSCEGEATRRAVEMALQEGMNPQEILDQGLLVGIEQVGYEFGRETFSSRSWWEPPWPCRRASTY